MLRRNFMAGFAALMGGGNKAAAHVASSIGIEKVAMDAVVGGLAGVTEVSGNPAHLHMDTYMAHAERVKERLGALRLLKTINPEWWQKEIRRNSRWTTTLDPNVACLHSVSMSAKISIQRDRNVKRWLEEREEGLEHTLAKNISLSMLGIKDGEF